jgi:acetolactate decarboxylase
MFRLILLVTSVALAEPPPQVNALFQVSTLDALSSGIYQGALSFHALGKEGNFGLGTFDSLDGEMVELDGRFYQIRSNGIVSRVDPDETTPFAAVTNFRTDLRATLIQPATFAQLTAWLDTVLPTQNFFYAIKVHGHFTDLTARSVPKQFPPFPPLATAVAQQSVFPLHDIDGTLVGFRSPAFEKGINQAGYHFHFISDDERSGGHALDFLAAHATVEIEILREHSTFFPDNPAFLAAPLPLP